MPKKAIQNKRKFIINNLNCQGALIKKSKIKKFWTLWQTTTYTLTKQHSAFWTSRIMLFCNFEKKFKKKLNFCPNKIAKILNTKKTNGPLNYSIGNSSYNFGFTQEPVHHKSRLDIAKSQSYQDSKIKTGFERTNIILKYRQAHY